MIGLFDRYNDDTKLLIQSLSTARISYSAIFIQYDGVLPQNALCPFTYYTKLTGEGKELFFDEVPVPEFCEIRQEKEIFGEILQDGFLIGKINYRPNSFRLVASVDWLHRDQSVARTDHYNQFGKCYSATFYHMGKAYQRVYYQKERLEIIQVNLLSGYISLYHDEKRYGFRNLTDFASHFWEELDLREKHVFINSLSYPLFLVRKRSSHANTLLFWQEKIGEKPPGNMVEELERPKALTDIVFFNENDWKRIKADFSSSKVHLSYLSHIGQFLSKENYDDKRAFILTNSDQVSGLGELLGAFPELTFSVAALTQMSEKLLRLTNKYPNLVLTPVINQKGIQTELEKASIYLDINAGGHVLEVVKTAYFSNLLVLALDSLAKEPDHSLNYQNIESLMEDLSAVLHAKGRKAQLLKKLHEKQGSRSTAEDYWKILDIGRLENHEV